jgi:HEAT repeat protein
VVPLLLQPRVRQDCKDVVLVALGEIHAGAETVVPILVESLTDYDISTRLSAAQALGSFGGEAKAAVPALIHLIGYEPDATVNKAARVALKAIDPEAAGKVGIE